MERRLKRRRRWWLWPAGGIALLVLLALIAPTRHAALRAIGATLAISDPLGPADVGVMTESGQAGELEMSDLYHEHVIPRVLILAPAEDAVAVELARRGVHHEDLMVTTLVELGVPKTAISTIDAGEGGTTESAEALSAWARAPPSRILLVVDPTHARRYRRSLMRVWPAGLESPRYTYPRDNPFRASDWWTSRRTRRDGIVEFARLLWDCLWHPW